MTTPRSLLWVTCLAAASTLWAGQAQAATFVVNSTGDEPDSMLNGVCSTGPPSNACTLRAALQEANRNPVTFDVIHFNIPGSGPHTIVLASTLPTIIQPVTIDGASQPGYAGTPIIELNAATVGASVLRLGSADSSGSTIRGLAINRSPVSAISIGSGSSNNVVVGNCLGTDPTGTIAAGNQVGVFLQSANNRIGGTTAADRNVISGNTVDGIQINGAASTGNLVQGNYIGLDATGTAGLGNTSQGVAIFGGAANNTIGGTAAGAGNVISGNGNDGVLIASPGTTGNRVEGNLIGTDASGTAAIGNVKGVELDASASGNTIGGTTAGASNLIAYNLSNGVAIAIGAGTSNAILSNAIHSNGFVGIDLPDPGVTPNDVGDGDTGANDLQNYPVLSAAMTNGVSSANLAGSLDSAPSTAYRVEFFANSIADPTGFGEGERYLGSTNLTTDATGHGVFGVTLTIGLTSGELVTATATDPSNNTSEFSAALVAVGSLVVTTTADTVDGTTTSVSALIASPGADGRISLREAILATNATPGADTIRFGIPLADANHFYYQDDSIAGSLTSVQTTALADSDVPDFDPDYPAGLAKSWYRIRPASALPSITDTAVLDGASQPGFLAGRPLIELNGAAAGAATALSLVGAASSGSTLRGLVIDQFGGIAIRILSSNNVVAGNYLGTDPTGTLARPNQVGLYIQGGNNRVGGTTAAERNIVSGNAVDGIDLDGTSATGNLVQGNYIGLDVQGASDLGNANLGIAIYNGAASNTVGGTAAGAGNAISGNNAYGISISGAGTAVNRIEGNFIGTDAVGTSAVGNVKGVVIAASASGNVVGGTSAGAGNRIAYNSDKGVALTTTGGTGNRISSNEIYSNGALGIDLREDGVTLNDAGDADTGPNNRQNFPVLSSVVTNGAGSVSIAGSLNSAAATTYRVEFFGSSAPDPTGFGEGERFLGFTNVTTDASGNAVIGVMLAASLTAGEFVTATATAPSNDTSEFSATVVAAAGSPPTISSAANQTFVVGTAPQLGAIITITEDAAVPTITAANDLRIRIPAGYPMRWVANQMTVSLGGSAAGKVATQVKAYEDFDRTVVLDVVTDFAAGDRLDVSSLRFWSFTAPAPVDNLALEIGNNDVVAALDDKTIRIVADGNPALSSNDDQVFTQGQPPTLASPFTITDGTTPVINTANDIRVRVPAGFNMTWDPTVSLVSISGPAAGSVSASVIYESGDQTLVIEVTANFTAGQYITVSGARFRGFSAPSPADSLVLDVGITDLDDKTVTIDSAGDVVFFTATATSQQVKLEWLTPKAGACDFVLITVRDDGIQPTGPFDGLARLVDNRPCTLDSKDSVTDVAATTNGNLYAYAAFVDDGGSFTAGKFVKARPMDTTGPVKWAYSTKATSMAPPGMRFSGGASYLYASSNDGILHAMNGGSTGGDWPSGFRPYDLGAPAQSRPPVVSFAVGAASQGAAFLSAQNGLVFAIDAVSGTEAWKRSIATMVQAAPAGHFKAFDATATDVILVGTRNGSSAVNTLEALDFATGAPVWSFDNSPAQLGDGKRIGVISGAAAVDYKDQRLFFASRVNTDVAGSNNTLWCISIAGASPQLLWAKPLGDVDGSPVLYMPPGFSDPVVYVGTASGIVYAVEASSGTVKWSLPLGDGAVKNFIFPQFGTANLLLSTQTKVWSLVDLGLNRGINWSVTSADIPAPSTPVFVPGSNWVYVGSGDGHLYQMDVNTPLPATRVQLGDGTSGVGIPGIDLLKAMIYVGSEQGVLYGVKYPLP